MSNKLADIVLWDLLNLLQLSMVQLSKIALIDFKACMLVLETAYMWFLRLVSNKKCPLRCVAIVKLAAVVHWAKDLKTLWSFLLRCFLSCRWASDYRVIADDKDHIQATLIDMVSPNQNFFWWLHPSLYLSHAVGPLRAAEYRLPSAMPMIFPT